jgi:hypothetical protein
VFLLQTSHFLQVTASIGAQMSLIKSADVPKHIADRLRSRRLAARLAGSAPKQSILPAKGAIASPAIAPAIAAVEPPTT